MGLSLRMVESPPMKLRRLALASVALAGVLNAALGCVADDPELFTRTPDGDAGARDAGAGDDAPATPDAALGFCARFAAAHDFCADFDTAARVTDGFIPEVRGDSDAPTFGSLASSPPRSMKAVVRHTPDGGADVPVSRMSYQKPLTTPGAQPTLAVAFAMYVAQADVPGRNVYITSIETPFGLFLALRRSDEDAGEPTCELLVVEGTSVVHVIPGVPIGRWTRIALTLAPRSSADGGPVGGGYTVELDDVVKTYPLPAQGLPPTLRVDVGLAVSNQIGADWTAYFDDVLIDGAR